MKTALIDKLLKRNWTRMDIQKYIGHYEQCWFTYAQDEIMRSNAASGGTVTALLSHLLKHDEIDGALVCTSHVEGNEVKAGYIIATSDEMLLQAQGSKYIETNFNRDAIPLIRDFKGRLALVLLPCDKRIVDFLFREHPEMEEKIRLTIALFCGHVSQPGLTRLMIKKVKPAGVSLTDFRYRIGRWRGKMCFTFENGTDVKKSFSLFSDFQNLNFFCAHKCLHCHDHTGYECDISVGDVWLMAMKGNPIKHNAVILRSPYSVEWVGKAIRDGRLVGQQVPAELIADAQFRSLPKHYNVTARSQAGKKLGIKISDTMNERVRLSDFLIAYVTLLNYRYSNTPKGRMLLSWLPRPVVKFYLYFLKALEVF